ncbi:AAA ATPase domain-containing protein [Cohnella sp. OV330]|uniref:LuxR C-terminal-related transcriptional regulator n=1 Tax=Cohnella sp. OV330 TaxID=1855288 RepID=UPI0008F18A51|nr:LuxR C-terminal-related transcriptional regulator [Cohnella sp. OV330]SFB48377.1 AAA ATPase domain-containing protein [Cohnella sp. OV330]
MSGTIGERLARLMDDYFVGRAFELGFFADWIGGEGRSAERLLNVYGPAGMGKTYLLRQYAGIASQAGYAAAEVQVPDALQGRDEFVRRLLAALGDDASASEASAAVPVSRPSSAEAASAAIGMAPATARDDEATGTLEERCLAVIRERDRAGGCVLLLDGCESLGSLDHWLRESFFPRLPGRCLIVMAGRRPLEGAWTALPAWRRLIVRLPLRELSYDDIRTYLARWGVADEAAIDGVWLRTMGHPLALSLLAPEGPAATSVADRRRAMAWSEPPLPSDGDRMPGTSALESLWEAWLAEAADEALLQALYAASAVRTFNLETLSELTGGTLSPTAFAELCRLSFVSRSGGGWQLQEFVWEHLRCRLRETMPQTYARLEARAAAYYRRQIEAELRSGRGLGPAWGELLRHAGNPVLRAHYRHAADAGSQWEPMHAGTLGEALRYIARRRQETRDWKVVCGDPDSGAMFRFALPQAVTQGRLAHLEPERLLALAPGAVRLLRDRDGHVAGIAAIVPIDVRTIGELSALPISRAYFAAWPEVKKRALAADPARREGWYVYAMDAENLEREDLRSAMLQPLLELAAAGALLVESPPPHAYYRLSKRSLGFVEVPEAAHADYELGETAATFELDTRGDAMQAFLRRTGAWTDDAETEVESPSRAEWTPGLSPESRLGDVRPEPLTPREREVGRRLVMGETNAQIGASLYISEAAVKKHVNAMLSKYGLRNRTQLAARLLEEGAERLGH